MPANCEDTGPLSLNCGQTHTQPTEFRGKIPSYSVGGPQSQKNLLLSHFTVPGKDQNEIRLKA
jgi:hypothetical protein